ncbi:MAG: aminopeptidase [Candidatus Rokuibacteriota bacterium]|nr:MAG: aminopeptidase [Candidatus Rokubacteria bacterium]
MTDPRVEAYAQLLVEHCLDVQPGWQVLVRTTPLSRPLLEEVSRLIARRGAYAIVRMDWSLWPGNIVWASEAPEELVAQMPDVDLYASDHMDARITIEAPENTREESELLPDRLALLKRYRAPFFRRTMAHEIPWVGCQYPTDALAQEAGLTLRQFEDVLYGACLIDWDAETAKMRRYLERFDAADEVRIVGDGTDLRLSLAGRSGEVDDGHVNMPGGEFFFSPVEDSAEGEIVFPEFPAVFEGQEFLGVRLIFEGGRVVDASAAAGHEHLLGILDRDEGAGRIGELGIGCNPGITHHMRNTLFDEKMDATVHIALGESYPHVGGQNVSSIHWDIVKDLRQGGRIELDGEAVQENGRWLI